MLFRTFAKTELGQLFELLSYSYLVGPTIQASTHAGEPIHTFAHLETFAALALHYPTTVHSAKCYFLPHLQTIATATVSGANWQKEEHLADSAPLVLFGLHACDINALNKLDKILLSGPYPDRSYATRRNRAFIIGVDCRPTGQCFCQSLGCDRAMHGYDLFLTDIGDHYFCEINSGAAYEVVKGLESREADHRDHALFVSARSRRDKAFTCRIDTSDLSRILDMEFEAAAWQHWGRQCFSCGTCANVCPTCYCHTIEHQVQTDLIHAEKIRRLYACTLVDFAEVAEQRNFRPDRASRLKYRYYHKHRGFVEAFEEPLCVGCGRCGRACLASITVPAVIASIRQEAAANE